MNQEFKKNKKWLIHLKLFILFSHFFSYISPQIKSINIGPIPEKNNTYSNSHTYKISYNYNCNYDMDYLTIKIENQISTSLGQIAFLSFNDAQCKNERKQMSINYEGDSLFIIKKTELQNLPYFYICVICLVDQIIDIT